MYDIERIILQQRKGGSRSIVEDIDLLVAMYDRSGSGKIQYIDFLNELIPRLQAWIEINKEHEKESKWRI